LIWDFSADVDFEIDSEIVKIVIIRKKSHVTLN